jgi:hypothetical protein
MEEDQTHPDYQKGYNDGSLIAGYEPELADRLKNLPQESPRMEGFQTGRKQLLRDRFRERMPEWVVDDPEQEIDPSFEPNKNKDHGIEPEL